MNTERTAPAPLIVLEGIDGSGKGTQAALLVDWLNAAGRSAALLSFPRYRDTFFGARIGEFLNGDYGPLDQLHPWLISLLYAGDRFESRSMLDRLRNEHQIVVLDRYVPSSLAHQVAKCAPGDRARLRNWIEELEYRIYGVPRPDLVVLLDCPIAVSQQLIRKKHVRSYTNRETDLQEADTDYLERVRRVYLELAAAEQTWVTVPVVSDGELRSVVSIHEEVRRAVEDWWSQPP